MIFLPQSIPDILLVKPAIHGDKRGFFAETFRQDLLEKATGNEIKFIQDNESKSSKGVLRGLHYQIPPFAQTKIVRVISGSVLDVVVDIRKSSDTFGNYLSFELSEENKHQLYIPKGFAHGFVVLSDFATFSYKVDNYYSPEYERGIAFDDKALGIDWRLPKENLLISEKDKNNPIFTEIKDKFS